MHNNRYSIYIDNPYNIDTIDNICYILFVIFNIIVIILLHIQQQYIKKLSSRSERGKNIIASLIIHPSVMVT